MLRAICLILSIFQSSAIAAVVGETVTVAPLSSLPLSARYFRPTGPGPFPAIIVMHGSGGLWVNNNPTNNIMTAHFEDWAQDFANDGYASLFVDSYTPRGIVEFGSRRPAEDPAKDDSLCSPAYERPKDAYKALVFLQSRPEISADRIGLLGFSQGAETALSSLLSASITRTNWTMSYLKLDGTTISTNFPAPVRLEGTNGFKVAVVYYPGCGFFGYFGGSSSTNANLYMPYAPTLIQHGSADPLYANDLYPEKLVLKSQSHATSRNLVFNPLQMTVYANATHSFDEAVLPQDPATDNANQSARRAARELTLAWFRAYLKSPTVKILRQQNGSLHLNWTAGAGVGHTILSGSDPASINSNIGQAQTITTDSNLNFEVNSQSPFQFFRLEVTRPGVL
jgi:dienelactone hydrolase